LFYLRWSQPNARRPFKGIQPTDNLAGVLENQAKFVDFV